jgi:hypothetical protein
MSLAEKQTPTVKVGVDRQPAFRLTWLVCRYGDTMGSPSQIRRRLYRVKPPGVAVYLTA